MASKKLKLEVDLETTKAKRQLAGMADGAFASPVDSAAGTITVTDGTTTVTSDASGNVK